MKIHVSFLAFVLVLFSAAPVALGGNSDPNSTSSDTDEVSSFLNSGSKDTTGSLSSEADPTLHADSIDDRKLAPAPKNEKYDFHLTVVQLGDSYSSGNGAFGLESHPIGPFWCFRQSECWGCQAIKEIEKEFKHPDQVQYVNKACSGSKMEHFSHNYELLQTEPEKSDRTKGKCDHNHIPEMFTVTIGNKCYNHMRPQKFEVSTNVDLVLLTTGGNNVNFDQIIEKCLVPVADFNNYINPFGSHHREQCAPLLEEAERYLRADELGLSPRFVDLFYQAMLELREGLRPDAKVVVASYPFITIEGWKEPDQGSRVINDYIRKLGVIANRKQLQVIEKLNADLKTNMFHFYEWTHKVFEGHEACTSERCFTTHPFLVELSSLSTALKVKFNMEKKKQLYHPNKEGQRAWGMHFSLFLRDSVLPQIATERRRRRDRSSAKYPDSAIDIAVLIDTTLKKEELKSIKKAFNEITDKLSLITDQWRFGVVAYGCDDDKLLQSFTDDVDLVKEAIGSIESKTCETGTSLLEGINEVFTSLPWRDGVTSSVIALAGTEPSASMSSDLLQNTVEQIKDIGVEIDVVAYDGVGAGEVINHLVNESGGIVIEPEPMRDVQDVVAELVTWFEDKAAIPVAYMADLGTYARGEPVSVSAQGSYDPQYKKIVSYMWNFLGGDAGGEVITTTPDAQFTYNEDFDGHITLEVKTSDGRTSNKISRSVLVNENGLPPGFCDTLYYPSEDERCCIEPTENERCNLKPPKNPKKQKKPKKNKPEKTPKGSKSPK